MQLKSLRNGREAHFFVYMVAETMVIAGIPEKITEKLLEICLGEHVECLEVVVQGSHEKRIVEIYVDSETGVSLDTCRILSQKFSELFESGNVFHSEYLLEVSSAGVERPLEFDWQYRKNIGRVLVVETKNSEKVKGRLSEVSENGITLAYVSEKGRAISKKKLENPQIIAWNDIDNSVVQLKF